MTNGTITVSDGRTVGFADYGTANQTAVLWCHGGPGNRLEPSIVADAAQRNGLRLVGIDRPGYGRSTPQPGRTIGGWVGDGLAVADHLGIDRFAVIGASTGGAYALALASCTARVIAAVACSALSDVGSAEIKALNVASSPLWYAPSRDAAIAMIAPAFGVRGEQLLPAPAVLDAADRLLFATDPFRSWWANCVPEIVTFGVEGFVDDRFADKNGWDSFDVANITCPVTILHGSADGLAPLANARHTVAILPGAMLRVVGDLGHFGTLTKVVEVMTETLSRCAKDTNLSMSTVS